MAKPEFYQDDRERVKSRSMLPTDTLRYIEALEVIARAAYRVWAGVREPATGEHRQAHDELYDALAVVNFMDEDQ